MVCIAMQKQAADRYRCVICEPNGPENLKPLVMYLRKHGATAVAVYDHPLYPAPIVNASMFDHLCQCAKRVFM